MIHHLPSAGADEAHARARYNAYKHLSEAERAELVELMREFGLSPGDISVHFAVSTNDLGTRLHLTEHLRNESGRKFADLAADQIASVPRVFDIDPARLPAAIRSAADTFTENEKP